MFIDVNKLLVDRVFVLCCFCQELIEEAADHCKFEMAVPAIVRPSSKTSLTEKISEKFNGDVSYVM